MPEYWFSSLAKVLQKFRHVKNILLIVNKKVQEVTAFSTGHSRNIFYTILNPLEHILRSGKAAGYHLSFFRKVLLSCIIFQSLPSLALRAKWNWESQTFYKTISLVLKFLGKIRSGRTSSAVPRTGRQKLEKLRLSPLVGPRPTSPGVHPNYSLSFTTNVDTSFPNHYIK